MEGPKVTVDYDVYKQMEEVLEAQRDAFKAWEEQDDVIVIRHRHFFNYLSTLNESDCITVPIVVAKGEEMCKKLYKEELDKAGLEIDNLLVKIQNLERELESRSRPAIDYVKLNNKFQDSVMPIAAIVLAVCLLILLLNTLFF